MCSSGTEMRKVMEEMLVQFINYMREVKQVSNNTLDSYYRDLARWIDFLQQAGIKEAERINETNLNSYVLALEKEGLSAATVRRHIASIKSFLLYLMKKGYMHGDPAERLKAPKAESGNPEYLTQEEISMLFQAAGSNSVRELRDRAILELLYGTGIKASELVHLVCGDVNQAGEYVIIREGGQERVLPLGTKALAAISCYLDCRSGQLHKEEKLDWLFLNRFGKSLTRQGLWRITRDYGRKAGLDKEVTPRILRNSCAVHMMEKGADLTTVSRILGHAGSFAACPGMLTAGKKRREAYREYHPRA